MAVYWHLGVDGISLPLVMLTALLVPIALAASTAIKHRVKEFVVYTLLLEAGLIGVFLSLDLFLFFVFFEAILIPMYFIIGIWGGERRDLRGHQVLPVHRLRFGLDAGRHHRPGDSPPAPNGCAILLVHRPVRSRR